MVFTKFLHFTKIFVGKTSVGGTSVGVTAADRTAVSVVSAVDIQNNIVMRNNILIM